MLVKDERFFLDGFNPHHRETLFMNACHHGDLPMVKLLLSMSSSKKLNIYATSLNPLRRDLSPVMIALHSYSLSITTILLKLLLSDKDKNRAIDIRSVRNTEVMENFLFIVHERALMALDHKGVFMALQVLESIISCVRSNRLIVSEDIKVKLIHFDRPSYLNALLHIDETQAITLYCKQPTVAQDPRLLLTSTRPVFVTGPHILLMSKSIMSIIASYLSVNEISTVTKTNKAFSANGLRKT